MMHSQQTTIDGFLMQAFLFPGQGSQFVGMAREAYINNGSVRDIMDRANDVLGFELTGVMFEGPEEELRQTENAQLAIFLHSYALFQQLRDPNPTMAAGHSLGEYTALTIANALTFDDALHLVRLRGESMRDAGAKIRGTMAAIIGLDDDDVSTLCREVSIGDAIVQGANYNAPGQVVISGVPEGVEAAMRLARERGARMAKELNVSGAFHSPLMEPARERLADALRMAPINNAEFPVYANVSACPVVTADAIRQSLLEQLTAPVLWKETIERMVVDGAREFVEVGPGNVLQGLIRRIDGTVTARSLSDLAGVDLFNDENSKRTEE